MMDGMKWSGGGTKCSETGKMIRGEFGDKGGEDCGMVGKGFEGWREKNVVNMCAIDGCRDLLGMRVGKSNR